MAGNDNYYPGVQVIERPFQQSSPATALADAVGGFIGRSNQGPETPTMVSSWGEFISQYGTTYTDLHNAVSDFFANYQGRCYIQRVVGANAVKAAVNIYASDAPQDPQNPGQVLPGTPPLITVEALNPGGWANLLHVTINPRDTTNKRFDLSLFRVPSTITFDPSQRNSEYLVEQWPDISLDPTDGRYIYDVINAPSTSGSKLIRVSGQSYDPATPAVRPYPVSTGFNKLVGGVDGSYVDVSFNSDASYQAAIDEMKEVDEPLVLNIPNVNDADVIRYAISMASTRGDVFVVIDPPVNKTPAEISSFAETDLGLGTLGEKQPSHGALYYPWVYLPALNSSSSGKTTLRPPGGAVVGLFLSTDQSIGVWKAPAGINARLGGAIQVERRLNEQELALLNNNHVNAIKPIKGSGIVVFGGRTLKKSGKDMYVPTRRTLIYCRESLKNLTAFAPFESNDAILWQEIRSRCNKFLGSLWSSGGLKGATSTEAWFVQCDSTNNTPSTVEAGVVNVEVGVALQTPAEFIIISIGQFDGGSTVTASV